MERIMADVPVEMKKTPLAPGATPDIWRSFRSEMDRLFDRFGDGFGWPGFGRFAPYLERLRRRPSTPRASSVPRTIW